MTLVLTLVAAALVAVLYVSYPTPDLGPEADYLELAALGVLGVSVVVQIVSLILKARRKKPAAQPVGVPKPTIKAPGARDAEIEAEVVQFVGRLQEKGRLVDFVMDDIAPYSNEQVGAAARVVHQGCREVLQSVFEIRPVHPGEEQESVSLSTDYDAHAYRLTGSVPEQPPYNGTVMHRGWKAARITLPRLSPEAAESSAREIIAPAEVEVRQEG